MYVSAYPTKRRTNKKVDSELTFDSIVPRREHTIPKEISLGSRGSILTPGIGSISKNVPPRMIIVVVKSIFGMPLNHPSCTVLPSPNLATWPDDANLLS